MHLCVCGCPGASDVEIRHLGRPIPTYPSPDGCSVPCRSSPRVASMRCFPHPARDAAHTVESGSLAVECVGVVPDRLFAHPPLRPHLQWRSAMTSPCSERELPPPPGSSPRPFSYNSRENCDTNVVPFLLSHGSKQRHHTGSGRAPCRRTSPLRETPHPPPPRADPPCRCSRATPRTGRRRLWSPLRRA